MEHNLVIKRNTRIGFLQFTIHMATWRPLAYFQLFGVINPRMLESKRKMLAFSVNVVKNKKGVAKILLLLLL